MQLLQNLRKTIQNLDASRDRIGIRKMAIPDGESSNQIDDLFNELSRWNDVLKDTSIGMKPPSP